jgi:signal transduction histidine kinase
MGRFVIGAARREAGRSLGASGSGAAGTEPTVTGVGLTRAGAPVAGAPSVRFDDAADRTRFWAGSMRGWDWAFYLMTALTVVAVVALRDQDGASLGLAVGAVVGLVATYTWVGRRAALTGDRRLVWVYLAVLIVAVSVTSAASLAGTVLLFVGFSQIWYFSPSRTVGVWLTVVLATAVFTAVGVRSGTSTAAELGGLLTQAAVTVAFSVLLGLWITQIAERSEERAELVDRLEAAQAEVARSHHAAGVTAERERMAREIHDTLAQGFTSIVMLSQAVRADVERGRTDAAVQRLELVERTARDNLAEARALVSAFSPVGLADSGIGAALVRLGERFGTETGVAVTVRVADPLPDVGREREVVLLRAAQEALTNVRRHAHASAALLELGVRPEGAVVLEISDDGTGIDPQVAEGFGLRGMRDRVTAEGGGLDVAARGEGGTRVLVTLPVGPAGATGATGSVGATGETTERTVEDR